MYRLLVTGGRRYDRADVVARVLERALVVHGDTLVVVHGACGADADRPWDHHTPTGADGLAHRWALWRGVRVEPHPARWGSSGRGAGPARNADMVRLGADACVAFPGGNGTEDCKRRALGAGIRVGIVSLAGALTWQ